MSGRETRTQQFANPYFDIDLTYDVLRADAAHLELQAIAGFFEQASGEAASFWVAPPGLSAVTGQAIGVGDGSRTVFPLVASIGSYIGPVYGTSGVAAVYLNGVAQPSGWSVSSGYLPAITFTSAPGAGVGHRRRLRRSLALPVRGRRAGLRGVYDDALGAPDRSARDG